MIVAQPVKKYPLYCGTERFIAVFTKMLSEQVSIVTEYVRLFQAGSPVCEHHTINVRYKPVRERSAFCEI